MTTIFAAVLGLIILVIIASFLIEEKYHQRKIRLRVQKIYGSQLFADMTPFLTQAKNLDIERLSIDKTGIAILCCGGSSQEAVFMLHSYGYSYFTEEQQEAMRIVLEESLPKLADKQKYRATRRTIRLLNGDTEYAFRYTITNEYKTLLFRASSFRAPINSSW